MSKPFDHEKDDDDGVTLDEVRQELDLPPGQNVDEVLLDMPEPATPDPMSFAEAISALTLGPRDVLAVIGAAGIDDAQTTHTYSDLLGRALHDSGHDNLVLVFPHGTKIKKVTLSDDQMATLTRQVPAGDGEEEDRVVRTPFGGFER
jgi:hypothetical protein